MIEENHPCEKCPIREVYAKLFDIHFWGDDCMYCCDEYEEYIRNERKEQVVHRDALYCPEEGV